MSSRGRPLSKQRRIKQNKRKTAQRRSQLFETLERREMMAADLMAEAHQAPMGPVQQDAVQVIFLDTDGASGVAYDGPVILEGINVDPFQVPEHLSGQEQQVIAIHERAISADHLHTIPVAIKCDADIQ